MSIVILFTSAGKEQVELLLMQKTVIGRSSKADLTIDDPRISGKHCRIEMSKQGQILFTDLDSTNGSYLENAKITTHLIRIGDKVRIGNTLISVDEKRLSATERIALGRNLNPGENLEAHPLDSSTMTSSGKLKPIKSEDGKKTVFEQQKSTGKTKFLKLDKDIPKKKK